MKVIILAGGKGSRISEESAVRPKPMVEIGGMPILWHIMKLYSSYGFNDFIICCGYKGSMIKDFFLEYGSHFGDVQCDIGNGKIQRYVEGKEHWKVTLVNTGYETKTAGRILQALKYVDDGEEFMVTYGDGVADIDLAALLDYHRTCGKTLTLSMTQPVGRFGGLDVNAEGVVLGFREKARRDQAWVNIGYMVSDKRLADYLGDGDAMLETKPFAMLVEDGELSAYSHEGFWAPMDTVHDRQVLEELWASGEAPWKVWE